MRNPPRSLSMMAAAVAVTVGTLDVPTARAEENKYPGSIRIEYEVPKDPAMAVLG